MADSSASSYSKGRMKIFSQSTPAQHLSTSLGLSVTLHLEGTTSGMRESSTQSRSLSTPCVSSKSSGSLSQAACQSWTHSLPLSRRLNSPGEDWRNESMGSC